MADMVHGMNNYVSQPLHVSEPTDELLIQGVMLGKQMAEESPVYGPLGVDLDRMIEFAYTMRASPQDFCMVAHTGDTCYGFLVASIGQYDFCDATYVFDRMLYVAPDRRGSKCARMLIDALEEWARERNVTRIVMGITTGVHTRTTERLYNKLGYDTFGVLTKKEL